MMNFKEIKETFDLLDDWEDRYGFLIDLGRQLPDMDPAYQNDAYLVKGCTSQVWMRLTVDEEGVLSILATSDAHIVRGLMAVLLSLFQGVTPKQATDIDVAAEFSALGLDSHLSPNRRNGFFAMVQTIQDFSISAT